MSDDHIADEFKGFQRHQLARSATHIATIAMSVASNCALGMWSPAFCSSDARVPAEEFLGLIEAEIRDMRLRMELQARLAEKQGEGA